MRFIKSWSPELTNTATSARTTSAHLDPRFYFSRTSVVRLSKYRFTQAVESREVSSGSNSPYCPKRRTLVKQGTPEFLTFPAIFFRAI
jgi:hypothetical protein